MAMGMSLLVSSSHSSSFFFLEKAGFRRLALGNWCGCRSCLYLYIKINHLYLHQNKKIALIVGSGFCNAKSAVSCRGPHSPSQSSFGTSRGAPLPTQQRKSWPHSNHIPFQIWAHPSPIFRKCITPKFFSDDLANHTSRFSSLEPEDPKINTVALQVDEDFLEALWTFKIIHFNAYSKLVIEKNALEKLHILVNLPTSSANLSCIKLIRSSVFYGVSKELGQIVVVVPPLNSLTEDQIKKVRSVCLETEDLKALKPQIFV